MAAAALSAASLAMAPAAQAAETWSTCCVAGVHAQSTATDAHSHITIAGYVRDTEADRQGVYIKMEFQQKNALGWWEVKDNRRVGNYQGYGTNLNSSWKKLHAGYESRLLITECLNRNNIGETPSGNVVAWHNWRTAIGARVGGHGTPHSRARRLGIALP